MRDSLVRMSNIAIEAPGTFVLGATSNPCQVPNGSTTFVCNLIDQHRAPATESSSRCVSIASPAAFVALPQGSFTANVLYLRTQNGESVDVRVTHATQGATVYPVRGTFLLEVPDDERISLVEIQGTAAIEYALTGPAT